MATLRRRFSSDGAEEPVTSQLLNDLQKPLGLPFNDGVQIEQTVGVGATYTIVHGLGRVPRGYLVLSLTGNLGYPVLSSSNKTNLVFSKGGLLTGSVKVWVFLCPCKNRLSK